MAYNPGPHVTPGTSDLRIAKPMLLISTPIGVIWGVVEAYRFKPVLALLMTVLLSVISAFIGYTVLTVRREQREQRNQQQLQSVANKQ